MTGPDRPTPDARASTGPPPPAGQPEGAPESARGPARGAGAEPPPSFGNVSEHHWSRARAGTNREAIDYYRERSRAPGVAAGGRERNFYCMDCDGVIPHDQAGRSCPHCGAALEGMARRYFNWVEIDQPPRSDSGPLLRLALGALIAVLILVFLVRWIGGLLG